jgi:hypothetical protein
MRKLTVVSLGALLLASAFGVCGTLSGCGESDNGQVKDTPEAKKADLNIQNSMKEFMQGKTKVKAPAKK